jgi:hypothetical protein
MKSDRMNNGKENELSKERLKKQKSKKYNK